MALQAEFQTLANCIDILTVIDELTGIGETGYGRATCSDEVDNFQSASVEALKSALTSALAVEDWEADHRKRALVEKACLQYSGYPHGKMLPNTMMLAGYRLLFHWTLIVFHPSEFWIGYSDRWCYANEAQIIAAIADWDGQGDAPEGWHRHPKTDRRRENGDPSRERAVQ